MAVHFEELWEKCENFHKDANTTDNIQNVIEELMLKINLYKAIDAKAEIPEADRKNIKSRTLGEILLTLAALSLKDDINVYESLNMALQYRSIDYFSKKHQL